MNNDSIRVHDSYAENDIIVNLTIGRILLGISIGFIILSFAFWDKARGKNNKNNSKEIVVKKSSTRSKKY